MTLVEGNIDIWVALYGWSSWQKTKYKKESKLSSQPNLIFEKAFESILDAEYFMSIIQSRSHEGRNGRVHPARRCSDVHHGKRVSLWRIYRMNKIKLKGRSPLASAAIATVASIIFAWKKDYVMLALGKSWMYFNFFFKHALVSEEFIEQIK